MPTPKKKTPLENHKICEQRHQIQTYINYYLFMVVVILLGIINPNIYFYQGLQFLFAALSLVGLVMWQHGWLYNKKRKFIVIFILFELMSTINVLHKKARPQELKFNCATIFK